MDDFRLDPISPYDSYRDRQPSGPGDRRKPKQPREPASGEDEVVLAEQGAPDAQAEDGTGGEDYYAPSGPAEGQE